MSSPPPDMAEFTYIGTAKLVALGHSALRAAIVESAEHLVGEAQSATPVETGTLKASIHAGDVRGSGASVSIRVSTGGEANEYAIFVHEGTGPHIIRAKNGKALSFNGILVKSVHHPGTKATKFLEGPLIANRPFYREAIARAARATF